MPPYLAWELDVSMGTVPFRFEHQWVMIYSQSPDQSPLLLSDKYF